MTCSGKAAGRYWSGAATNRNTFLPASPTGLPGWFLPTDILPAPCTKLPTGVLPVSTAAHCTTMVTGIVRTGLPPEQQQAFENVEIRPQAIEWLFSLAAGSRFHISVDNLAGDGAADEQAFRRNVCKQAADYLEHGLPERAQQFFDTLKQFYNTSTRIGHDWNHDKVRIAPAGNEYLKSRTADTL